MKVSRNSPQNLFRATPQTFGSLDEGLSVIVSWGQSDGSENLHEIFWAGVHKAEEDVTRLETVPGVGKELEDALLDSLQLVHQEVLNKKNAHLLQTVVEFAALIRQDDALYFGACGDFTLAQVQNKRTQLLLHFPHLQGLSRTLPQNFLGSAINPSLQFGKAPFSENDHLVLAGGFARSSQLEMLAATDLANPMVKLVPLDPHSPWWLLHAE